MQSTTHIPNMHFNLSYLLWNVRPKFYPNWNHYDQNFDKFESRLDYSNFNIFYFIFLNLYSPILISFKENHIFKLQLMVFPFLIVFVK